MHLESHTSELGQKLIESQDECQNYQIACRRIVDEVIRFREVHEGQNSALVTRVSGWLALFGKRLETVSSQAEFVVEDYKERENLIAELQNKGGIFREERAEGGERVKSPAEQHFESKNTRR